MIPTLLQHDLLYYWRTFCKELWGWNSEALFKIEIFLYVNQWLLFTFSCNSKASVLLICWIKRRLIGPSWEQYPDLFECKLFNNSCWPYLFQGWIYQQFLAYVGYWGFIMEGVLSLQHNVLLYAVRPTTGVWGTKIWSRLHVTLGFKIVLLTRIWLWRLFALASSDRDLQQTDLYYDAHGMTNLSLGVTTKNGTPEIYETLSTS